MNHRETEAGDAGERPAQEAAGPRVSQGLVKTAIRLAKLLNAPGAPRR
jgi:hypothetical protein